MKRLVIICVFILAHLTSIRGQDITLKNLLNLQRESLLNVQNYLDLNKWTLTHTITIADEDSLIWGFKVRKFIDSLKVNKSTNVASRQDYFNSFLRNTYDANTPLCFYYSPHNDKAKNNLTIADLMIRLPNEILYHSISLGHMDYWNQNFHQVIELSYNGKEIQSILRQIAALKIPKDSAYIVYDKQAIKRVYRYHDQIITVTTFDLNNSSDLERNYSIEVGSKQDYLFLNASELYLKGKIDNIQ